MTPHRNNNLDQCARVTVHKMRRMLLPVLCCMLLMPGDGMFPVPFTATEMVCVLLSDLFNAQSCVRRPDDAFDN